MWWWQKRLSGNGISKASAPRVADNDRRAVEKVRVFRRSLVKAR